MASNDFTDGEKILCFHGPLIYEAKCLRHRVSEEDKKNEYLVHYQGWNKNWDEWVPATRILKYNDDNLAKQKELVKSRQECRIKRSKGNSKTPKKDIKQGDAKSEGSVHDPDSRSSTPSVDGRLRGKDVKAKGKSQKDASPLPPEEETTTDVKSDAAEAVSGSQESAMTETPSRHVKRTLPEPEEPLFIPEKRRKSARVVRISDIDFKREQIFSDPENTTLELPPQLARWIIDDWDQIVRLTRLVNLPADITVADILSRYEAFKIKSSPPEQHGVIRLVVEQVEELFCQLLGSFLLHKWERPQYADLLETYHGVKVSKIYGSIHFLRLFHQAGRVLSTLPADAMQGACDELTDIMDFLAKNVKELFKMSNFGTATPEYHRRAI